MNFSDEQRQALNNLYTHREAIENHLAEIESILMVYFEKEYPLSYQHWIPQIKTALRSNTKWLSRGEYSMDYILANIEDKIIDNCCNKGVSKFIK